jgi:hypothetical protein
MNHPRIRMSKLALGLVVALAAAPAFAQSTSSGIGGLVTSAAGQPVTGAEVTITHVESGSVSRASTDAAGRYNARGLRVGGPYTVTITKPGEGTKTEEGVYLTLNQVNTINAALTGDLAATTLEGVTAYAYAGGSEVFSATKMGSGTAVDRQTIEALPSMNGNIQDYMRLDPRVAFTDRASGSISAGGMNPRFNKITIDGVSASDSFGLEGNNMPTQRQPVSMEAIEAMDISLSNYDVTIAGAAGANINAVTKSGTNEFHGSVYGYMRDADWYGEHPLTGQDYAEFSKEETYGMTLGGPVIKDKLFFFANYEKYTKSAPSPDLSSSPLFNPNADFDASDLAQVVGIAKDKWGIDAGTPEGSGNGNTTLEEYAVKLDWNINESHRANVRYSKLDQERVRPSAPSASGLPLSSSWFNHAKSVESIVGQVFSDWSDTFSTEFKVSYRDYSAVRVNPTNSPLVTVYFDDGNDSIPVTNGDFIRFGTERSSMGNALQTKTWNYFGAATWTLGDHDVKFGAEFSDNEIYNFFLQDAWGNYSFYGIDAFERGEYFDYDLNANLTNPGAIAAQYSNRNLGLFLQDTWYVNNNLTLTLGVRADQITTDRDPQFNACFSAAPGAANTALCGSRHTGGFGLNNSNSLSDKFLIQPRFGFNYTFDTDRLMQVRGGVGLFQGDAPQVWISNSYQSTGLNYLAYQNLSDWQNIKFNPNGLTQNPTGGQPPVQNVNVISDDFEMPSVWKTNLAIDVETPWHGIVASAELLLSEVDNGIYYNTLNIGPGYQDAYGRMMYWNPNAGNFSSTNNNRYGRNSYFGDVFLLENTSKGYSRQLTVMLNKPWSPDSDWSWSLGYTYTNATEVGALTSSTAGSGFGGQYNFNVNENTAGTSRYEIKDRISGSLNWKHAFFGDYETKVGLVYEGRSGRPYSMIFAGDANGDSRTFNDLFYMPSGPGDVLFGSLNNAGVFTANPQMEADFWKWAESKKELAGYAGTYVPENALRSKWINTFDVRISQDLPGFMKGHKSQIWLDVQNIGNMINKDWGHILDYGFNGNEAAASLIGIDKATGKYVYGYRSGTQFGQPGAVGVPTDSDGNTNGISQWSLQLGFRYQF